jgi:predicted transcriptional regulator YdeE
MPLAQYTVPQGKKERKKERKKENIPELMEENRFKVLTEIHAGHTGSMSRQNS